MRFTCKTLSAVMLALPLALGCPLQAALSAGLASSVVPAAPRHAPVTPRADLAGFAALNAIESEKRAERKVFESENRAAPKVTESENCAAAKAITSEKRATGSAIVEPESLSAFPGQADIMPSISALSNFCKRPGSLAYLTRDGCLAALSRLAQDYSSYLYYESLADCLDFLQSQRGARDFIVEERKAWCDQSFENLHDIKGCYAAVPVFLGSLTEAGFCRQAPPLPARPKDAEALYLYGYQEPGQKLDTPKLGRGPAHRKSAKPAPGRRPAAKPAHSKPESLRSTPQSAGFSGTGAGPAQAVSTSGGAVLLDNGSVPPAADTQAGKAAPSAPATRMTAPGPVPNASGASGQSTMATPGGAVPAGLLVGQKLQPGSGSATPMGLQNSVTQPVAKPAAEAVAAAPGASAQAGTVAALAPSGSNIPVWPAAGNFPAALEEPADFASAVSADVSAAHGNLNASGTELPPAPQSGQGPARLNLPPLVSAPPLPESEPVIGTRLQVEPLPPVPSIGRIVPELMPGVPPDRAVAAATLPPPADAPTAAAQSAPQAVDAFGEVIPNFVPQTRPDPLAAPTLAMPVGRAPAGQAAAIN